MNNFSHSASQSKEDFVVYLVDAWKDRAMLGGKRRLKVKAWATTRDIKFAVAKLLRIPSSRQRLFFRSRELKDHRTLEESGIHKSGATLLFDARVDSLLSECRSSSSLSSSSSSSGTAATTTTTTATATTTATTTTTTTTTATSRGGQQRPCFLPKKQRSSTCLEPVSCAALHGGDGALPSALQRAMLKARRALLVVGAKAPELAMEGTGGTYFMFGLDGRPVACFKPADEEPFCVNNPRHFVGPYGGGPASATKASSKPPPSSSSSSSVRKIVSTDDGTAKSSFRGDLEDDNGMVGSSDDDSAEDEAKQGRSSRGTSSSLRGAGGESSESSSNELGTTTPSAAPSSSSWLSMRNGVRPGEAYLREVAAYLLDRSAGGLAGVPETTLVECSHPKFHYHDRNVREKLGSFQAYVAHDGVAEDYGVDRLSVDRVQAVAALDMRGLNCDRNAANLLVVGGRRKGVAFDDTTTTGRGAAMDVIPIDHGYCLPDVLEIEWFDWCWIDWPQVAKPVAPKLKEALSKSDPFADAKALKEALGLGREALRLTTASGLLLKLGVKAGLTLRDVASLVVVPATTDLDSTRSAGGAARQRDRSRLAVAVERAHELAALALRDDRTRAIRPKTSWFGDQAKTTAAKTQRAKKEAKAKEEANEAKTLDAPPPPPPPPRSEGKEHHGGGHREVAVFETKDLGTLRISISPAKTPSKKAPRRVAFPRDKDDDDQELDECLRGSLEEDDRNFRPERATFQDDDDDDQEDDDDDHEEDAEYGDEASRGWSRVLGQVPVDPVEAPSWTAEPRGPPRLLRKDATGQTDALATSPPHAQTTSPPPPTQKTPQQRKGAYAKRALLREDHEPRSSLVRLRSCPALVNDPASEDRRAPLKHRRLEGRALQRAASGKQDYDRHFYHFLHGILDDLVRWKLHHRD